MNNKKMELKTEYLIAEPVCEYTEVVTENSEHTKETLHNQAVEQQQKKPILLQNLPTRKHEDQTVESSVEDDVFHLCTEVPCNHNFIHNDTSPLDNFESLRKNGISPVLSDNSIDVNINQHDKFECVNTDDKTIIFQHNSFIPMSAKTSDSNVIALPVPDTVNCIASNQNDFSPTSLNFEPGINERFNSYEENENDICKFDAQELSQESDLSTFSIDGSSAKVKVHNMFSKLPYRSTGVHLLPPCRICGEKASGFHYGVNTCEACKGFFRRSCKRVSEYVCVDSNNRCIIEPGKRSICPKCRYDKCIREGMSKSAIKTGRYTHEKRSRDIIEVKQLEKQEKTKDTSKPMPISFIQDQDRDEVEGLCYLLIRAQKEMYSEKYDYWTDGQMIRSIAEDCYKKHVAKMNIFGDLNKLPEDEFKTFYNTTGIDIDNRIELMSEIATTLESGISRYINFVKHIPGFSSLTLDDQAALIKAARFEFWFVGYQRFVCPDLEVSAGILKQCHHKSELSKVVGTEFVDELFLHSQKMQSLNLTVEDIAVLRAFLVVSPDRCDLQNRDAIEKIQWKMMMCLQYICDKNHGDQAGYLSRVLDRVTNLRELTELNEKRAQSIKVEWPILKNHPLLVELMSG